MRSVLAPFLAVLVLVGLRLAYGRGVRAARAVWPPDLLAELREHKLRCQHESPGRVALELALAFEHTSRQEPRARARS